MNRKDIIPFITQKIDDLARNVFPQIDDLSDKGFDVTPSVQFFLHEALQYLKDALEETGGKVKWEKKIEKTKPEANDLREKLH